METGKKRIEAEDGSSHIRLHSSRTSQAVIVMMPAGELRVSVDHREVDASTQNNRIMVLQISTFQRRCNNLGNG